MSEKLVVKILMVAGHIGLAMSVIFILFSILGMAMTTERHVDYTNAFMVLGAALVSFITFTAFIGFAYIVKHVCKVED